MIKNLLKILLFFYTSFLFAEDQQLTFHFCYQFEGNQFFVSENNKTIDYSISTIEEDDKNGIVFDLNKLAIKQEFYFSSNNLLDKLSIIPEDKKTSQLCLFESINKNTDPTYNCEQLISWSFVWKKIDGEIEYSPFSFKKCK